MKGEVGGQGAGLYREIEVLFMLMMGAVLLLFQKEHVSMLQVIW